MTIDHQLPNSSPRPSRSMIIWTVVIAVALPAVSWVVGLNWVNCLLLSCAVVVVAAFGFLGGLEDEERWPDLEQGGRDLGARRELSRLSWALDGFEERVSPTSTARIRQLAVVRLARHGVDLDSEVDQSKARALLGHYPYAVLTGEATDRPSYAIFVQCVHAVEQLDRLDRPEGAPRL